MKTRIVWLSSIVLLGCVVAGTLWSQPPTSGTGGTGGQGGPGGPGGPGGGFRRRGPQPPPEVKLPDDPRLLAFHKQFVETAEKLAGEYEVAKPPKYDKAQACYEEILRLVPNFPGIQEKLDAVKALAAGKEKRTVTVLANDDWQDTGITVQLNKPVIITAEGEWKFVMNYDLDTDGLEIPKELQDFAIGSLIGIIRTNNPKNDKPFLVGARKEFNADKTGRLMLRMYDSDLSDNSGKLTVTITGTYEHKRVAGAAAGAAAAN